MPPLPPFADVGDAYDAALALLADSLGRVHAAGGTKRLRPVDAHSIGTAHRELVQTCAALINVDWPAPPVTREALIRWGRLATAARELLDAGPPGAEAPPSADLLIETDRSRKIPWRLQAAKPLRVPSLGPARSLHGLLSAMSAPALDRICEGLLDAPAITKKVAVRELSAFLASGAGRERVLSLLDGDSYALLVKLLEEGGELPLERLSLAWGPTWQPPWEPPSAPLPWLQRLGLVVVGWDTGPQQQVVVVVPAELRPALAPARWPEGAAAPPLVELHVELSGVTPPIWRRIQLCGDATLLELHFALQSAFGWRSVRPHEFRIAMRARPGHTVRVGARLGGGLSDEESAFVAGVLGEPGDMLIYRYGLEDGWDHVVQRQAPSSAGLEGRRRLLDGGRGAPVDEPAEAPVSPPARARPARSRYPETFKLRAAQRRFHR